MAASEEVALIKGKIWVRLQGGSETGPHEH